MHAKALFVENPEKTIFRYHADIVQPHLPRANMEKKDIVLKDAVVKRVGIKGIKKLEIPEDVYCLSAEVYGNLVANGIVVSNCDALRYAIYTHFFLRDGQSASAQDLDRMYNETRGISDQKLPSFFQQPNDGYARF